MRPQNATLGLLLGIVAVVLFGASVPATRAAVAGLEPWFTTFARAALGGVLALASLAVFRTRFPRQHLMRILISAACVVIFAPLFMALGLQTVPSAHGAVIMGLLPLATTAAGVAIAGERPSPLFWLLSVAGAVVVAVFALRDSDIAIVTGDIFLALCVVLYSTGYAVSAVLAREMPGRQVIAWGLVLALPIALIGTIALWPADFASVPTASWLGLAYIGIFSQFIGFAFWNMALGMGGVARVGQLQLMQPFVSIGLAALVLGEHIDAATILFAIAIVVIVALGRRAGVRRPSAPT